MIWIGIVIGIAIVGSFSIGMMIGSTRTIQVSVSPLPRLDTTLKPLKAHNPDYQTFNQAQTEEE